MTAGFLLLLGALSRTVWDGVYTEEQAKRGEELYQKECASCHGDALLGGEMAPPLEGAAFTANWNGVPLGEILERIRATMPENAPGKLSRQQNADVLSYILKFNRFPAGEKELPRETDVLNEIVFVPEKP